MLKSAVPFLLFEPDLFFPTNVDARKRKFGKFINQARGQPFMIGAFQLLDGEIGADQHRLFKIEPIVDNTVQHTVGDSPEEILGQGVAFHQAVQQRGPVKQGECRHHDIRFGGDTFPA